MIGKNELRDSILHDLKVARALTAKLPRGAADYRPCAEQRTTLELARYLCMVTQGCVHAGIDGSWAWFGANGERFNTLTLDQVPAALDEEMAEITRLFAGISDDDFAGKVVDMESSHMGKWKLQGWLLNTAAKFTSSYKLQLFLYAKAGGNKDLNTWDAWMDTGGIGRPQPVEA